MATEILTPKTLAGLRVQPVRERSLYLNCLIYGKSGVGKTTLLGSAVDVPEMDPLLIVDIEGGTTSLRHAYPKAEVVRVTTWQEMQEVYNELYNMKHGYRTVGLDSLTEIQKFNMYDIMAGLVKEHADRDPDIPGMREWGKNIEQIRRFVRAFRDLEMHTIFTALDRQDKDQRTGVTTTLPQLSGKLAGEVAAFLDVVVYLYVKQIGTGEDATHQRLLLTQATEQQVAKDRSGQLPMVVQEPTMAKLFQIMYPNNLDTLNTTQVEDQYQSLISN